MPETTCLRFAQSEAIENAVTTHTAWANDGFGVISSWDFLKIAVAIHIKCFCYLIYWCCLRQNNRLSFTPVLAHTYLYFKFFAFVWHFEHCNFLYLKSSNLVWALMLWAHHHRWLYIWSYEEGVMFQYYYPMCTLLLNWSSLPSSMKMDGVLVEGLTIECSPE